jgi:hypothetical protein
MVQTNEQERSVVDGLANQIDVVIAEYNHQWLKCCSCSQKLLNSKKGVIIPRVNIHWYFIEECHTICDKRQAFNISLFN